MIFAFFDTCLGVDGCNWKVSRKGHGFSFSKSQFVFVAKNHVPSLPNNMIVGIFVLKRRIQNLPTSSPSYIPKNFHHYLSMYGQRHTFVLNMKMGNRYLQQHLERIILSRQKYKFFGQTSRFCLFYQSESCASDTKSCIEDIDSRFCRENDKSFRACKVYPNTRCIGTKHVPNELKIAIVLSTIKGECTTHRICSQLFQTSLQRDYVFCRGG